VGLYCAEGTYLATVRVPFCPMAKLGVAWTRGFTFFRHFVSLGGRD